MPNLPLLTASTTCNFSLPTRVDVQNNNNQQDYEYRQQNCVTQFFTNSSSSQRLPVTDVVATTSTSSPIASSSAFSVNPVFTGGDIMLITIAITAFVLWIGVLVARSLGFIHTKKTYLGYNGGDVEIRQDN